jgi:signal transduction histidine kinase
VRANGVLGDEQPSGDLVGAEPLVEQEQNLDLPGTQLLGDRLRDARVEPAALAHPVEQPPRDLARQGCLAARDSAEELGDPLRRLGLQQVAGCAAADRGEQVLVGSGGGQDNHLAAGRSGPQPRQGLEAAEAGHREVEQDEVGLEVSSAADRLLAVPRLRHDREAMLLEQADESRSRKRVVVDDERAPAHASLIGRRPCADKRCMRTARATYLAWVRDEIVLVALLAAALTLFLASPGLRNPYALASLRLSLDTAVLLVSVIVAVLAYVRFTVERRRFDLYLLAGFFVTAATTLAFTVAPALDDSTVGRAETWAGIGGRLIAALLIAAAPWASGRVATPAQALATIVALALLLAGIEAACRKLGSSLPLLAPERAQPGLLTAALALQALLSLAALVGFGARYRAHGEDLDQWLAFGATIWLFAELHAVFTPPLSSDYVSQGDFLRLLSYAVLLVGVWRAIRAAEFGRAVAEERARVARDIHDGLAQYLFAISTVTSRLDGGAELETVLPQLREAATAAQQEARFAVLALSSAGGTASLDSALSRYIDILTADGQLDVDLEIEPGVELGPDEQIEVFRIVQEGLANVRRHAGARSATVLIGLRDGRRVIRIEDDGRGLADEVDGRGQGLTNMKIRAAAIGGRFRLTSSPGAGTALEVVLRAG